MKKKKVFALVLVCAMLVAALAGCGGGGKTGGEPSGTGSGDSGSNTDSGDTGKKEDPYEATFMYYVSNDAAPDIQAVEDRFNELTMEALNMKVDLMPVSFGTYTQQIQLMLSGGEALDIFPMGPDVAGTYIDAQYIVNVADYLDKAPDAVSIIGQEDIECCSVGDFIWGFPVMMERTHPSAFVMRNDILQELNINAEEINSLDALGEVFAKVHEAYPNMVIFNGQYNMSPATISNHVDTLGDRFGVLDNYGESTTVVNYYETEEYKNLVNHMREWYQAGYVSKDFATSNDAGESLMRAGNLFCFTTNAKPDSKKEKDVMTGFDTVVYEFNDTFLSTWGTATLGYAVANNSKDPAKAVELYNWIVSTKEANDLLNWGVEGKNWVETEDGTAAYPDGVDMNSVGYHQDFGWAHPNQQNAHVWQGNDPATYEVYQQLRDEAKVSPAYGFSFDSRPVLNEIAALTAVRDQYANTIGSGSVEPEQAIADFNKALYDAGLQKVIDEKQRQLDEWLAAQE